MNHKAAGSLLMAIIVIALGTGFLLAYRSTGFFWAYR